MLEVCSGVTNEKEKDGGYKRSGQTLVRGAKSDGSSAMCGDWVERPIYCVPIPLTGSEATSRPRDREHSAC